METLMSYVGRLPKDFAFHLSPVNEISKCAFHSHDYYEFSYVFHGKGKHITEGKEENFSDSSFFFTPPGITHGFISDGNEVIQQTSFVIYPSLFEKSSFDFDAIKLLNYLTEKRLYTLTVNNNARGVNALINEIHEEYYLKIENYQNIILANLYKIFIFIEREVHQQRTVFSKFNNPHPIILQVLKSLEKEYYKINSVKDILSTHKIDEKYFIRLFKKNISLTPIQYLNRLKIEKIAFLLLNNKRMKISEIAVDGGFNDLRYFNKLFKKYLNQTPTEFRQEANYTNLNRIDRFKFQK